MGNPGLYRYFRRGILGWAALHERRFPWRDTRDPWHVLLAEILLQRTNANQVVQVWEDLLRVAGTAESAAACPEALRVIFGRLGLLRRAECVGRLATTIKERFGGVVPIDPDVLMALPGVGRYTAAAVACFAGDKRVALVDSNVVRVFARFFGWTTSRRDKPERDPEIWKLAEKVMPRTTNPAAWNRALLDFAAMVCAYRNPRCAECPVRGRCWWLARQADAEPLALACSPGAGSREVRLLPRSDTADSSKTAQASSSTGGWPVCGV